MKNFLFTVSFMATIFLSLSTRAQQASVMFEIENAGVPVTGTVDEVTTTIVFKEDALAQSSIQATAAVSSLHTGIAIRDKHMMQGDYFDVARFPVISLRSVSLSKKNRKTFSGQFILTIRDISKTIEIPFTATRKNNVITLHTTFTINRLDFGLGEKSSILSDDVLITLRATQQE